jgi:hypothetical protein
MWCRTSQVWKPDLRRQSCETDDLAEIRAELAHIRFLLKDEPKSSVALRPREKTEGAR